MKLLTRIAQHAVRKSEQIAYRTEGQMLTYGMLWDKSRRLASLLHAIKLERQTPIVVYGHMGIDMPVSFLACVQAGHPYIPVDTSIPIERVRLIVEKSGAGVVINTTTSKLDFDGVIVLQMLEMNLEQIEHIGEEYWVQSDEVFISFIRPAVLEILREFK